MKEYFIIFGIFLVIYFLLANVKYLLKLGCFLLAMVGVYVTFFIGGLIWRLVSFLFF